MVEGRELKSNLLHLRDELAMLLGVAGTPGEFPFQELASIIGRQGAEWKLKSECLKVIGEVSVTPIHPDDSGLFSVSSAN